MTTCQHCKHWFTDDPGQIRLPDRGICLKANTVESEGRRLTHSDERSQAHTTATVISSFGYRIVVSQLETTAEFGCNQFEEGVD